MNREEGAYMDMLIKEKSRLRKTLNKFKERELLIKKFIDDLYWEYDRMSSSGTETLDKLYTLFGDTLRSSLLPKKKLKKGDNK